MKYLILLSLVALAACDTYTPENDDLDIEAVVADVDKLKAFYNCFMDTGSCDAIQQDFKKDLPEVVAEACAKCTAKQKHIAKKFIEGLKQKLPEEYQNFQKKYDPESKYFLKLETAVANA